MDAEDLEYRGRIIHLIRGADGHWSATAWRGPRSLEQVGALQVSTTREAVLRLARKLVDRDLQSVEPDRPPPGE